VRLVTALHARVLPKPGSHLLADEMNIREARDEDADQIVGIFHETVHSVNFEAKRAG